MTITRTKNIGTITRENFPSAAVFKRYGIDFCCGGNRPLEEVCLDKGLDPEKVIEEIEQAVAKSSRENLMDFDVWPLDLLADYIEKKHHRYVEEKTPEINAYLDKVCKVHGKNHPELFEINSLFKEAAQALAAHMKKEELMLFPYIRKMRAAKKLGKVLGTPGFGTVNNPVQKMMDEHDTEGERFEKIAALSNNYTPPEDACNTYRLAYSLLEDFEADLHIHIHLENNILFPKAIDLEKK